MAEPTTVKKRATLKAYKPSLRERAQIGMEGLYTRATGREPGYAPRRLMGKASELLDFIPGVGDVIGIDETKRALDRRQYLEAGLTGAGTMLGVVPIVGDVAGKALKGAAKPAQKALEKLAAKYGVEVPKVRADDLDMLGSDWLSNKQRSVREAQVAAEKAGYAPDAPLGPITGYTERPMLMDPAKVSQFPGAMNEVPKPGNPKYDALMKSMSKKGYDPEQGGSIVVGVSHQGTPYIIEGNNRAAVARDLGLPAIPAEVRWYTGGERATGALSPDKLADYAYRPAPAAQDLGAKYGLPEFTTDLTPAQIEANRAAYPTRAYHGTPSTHGEEGTFTTFRDANAGDEYMLDRRLGAHFAKDPATSNTFLYDMGDTGVFPKKGAHILPVRLPAEHEFLDVDQPLISWTDPNSPDFRPPPEGVEREALRYTDQRAVEELVALEAYRRDPDLLARYLVQARNVNPSDAPRLTQEFLKGSEVALPYDDKPRTLPEFLRNYGGNPYNDADRVRVVELAREALKEKGYKGLRYYNTSSTETRKAADKTAYIVFDPQRDVKSTMNRGTFDPNEPNLSKARGGLVKKYGV